MTGPDVELLEVFHDEAVERLDRMVETLLALEAGRAPADAVDSLFRDAHSIKGSAGMVGNEAARTIAHGMEDMLEGPRGQGTFAPELIDPMLRAADAIRSAVEGEGEGGLASAALEELSASISETKAEPPPASPPQPGGRRSMRISAEKVDRLLDAVGETVLQSRRIDRLVGGDLPAGRDDDRIEGELGRSEAMLDELQDSVIQLRTLPLSSITAPFPRAVRDLAAAQGKQAALEISGDETQLDRVILDGISQSITHLLRNAVAHGIEPPGERERAGKPARGRVELRGDQRGSLVAIEVLDDGRGVAPDLLSTMDEGARLADALAEAGFSTAAEVTDVSGRGVGLDAVKSRVESLGGGLEVHSKPGVGTTVTMLLPLTLALLHVLLVERGGQRFGVPLMSVDEVITVAGTMSLGGREALEIRGRSVALADLAEVIDAEAPELRPRPQAMVVTSSGRRAGILCDQILEEQEVVVKGLGPLLTGLGGYLGAAIMDDGGIALILDPAALTKRHALGRTVRRSSKHDVAPPKVLVVDDQFTVRELQRSILEAAGYRVETARDGDQALRRIEAEPEIGLVVTDVEMPAMDGIELLHRIRQDGDRSSLPVVVVTSRGGEEHRTRGLDAGADAYIVKDEFSQRTLLETVDRLLSR